MARIRTIKPDFPQSESMGRVSRDARLLFILLWTVSDDSGRTRGNSRILASLLFPYDDDAIKHIDKWIAELEREGCLVRYHAEGSTYIEVHNWLKHQKIDKPSPSKIPQFDEDSEIIREDSRGFDNSPSRKGRERKGVEGKGKDMSSDLDIIHSIIEKTNLLLGKNFKGSKESVANIKARLSEGRIATDFETVCTNMLTAWGEDPKMCQYLNPDTLYGNKFDKYLNMTPAISIRSIVSKNGAEMLQGAAALLARRQRERGEEVGSPMQIGHSV